MEKEIIDYDLLIANNKLIHEFMGLKPEIEYHVGSVDGKSIRYMPSQQYFPTAPCQKQECKRFLLEQIKNGWGDGCAVIKTENYPYYNNSWDLLMPVVKAIGDLCAEKSNRSMWKDIVDIALATVDFKLTYKYTVDYIVWLNAKMKEVNNGFKL